jgi:hypothetical protein
LPLETHEFIFEYLIHLLENFIDTHKLIIHMNVNKFPIERRIPSSAREILIYLQNKDETIDPDNLLNCLLKNENLYGIERFTVSHYNWSKTMNMEISEFILAFIESFITVNFNFLLE